MGMPSSDADRVAHYDAKVAPTTVGLKIAARLSGMKSDFAAFAADFVPKQMLVNAELGKVNTIFPLAYGGYQAYASQLWKLQKTTTQPAIDAVAQLIKDKWVFWGLDAPTSIAIAINVFSITVI